MQDYFKYDITSPSCISRLKGQYAGHCGSLDKDGYYVVNKVKTQYKAHRIVWQLHHGDIPDGMEIDHINHKRGDNRIDNLRLVTKSQNQRNKISKGYYYNKEKKKWQVQSAIEGKQKYLGRFNIEEEAKTFIKQYKEQHNVF